ncbi:phosphatase PAP2 family protein [Candidatus Lokiarchaeum ossiferum]|uniref:phosphatase PAP2 family protein n=1 Tax=Candidatus Lokiarchaeum ossiferum TaxID=2951803 RepID=UPI00352EEB42
MRAITEKSENAKLETEPIKKNIKNWMRKYRFFILFGIILLVGTIILKFNDGQIDKAITDLFYDESLPVGERFYLENVQPWYFLNEYNDIFEYLLYITLIPMIIIGAINYKKLGYLLIYGSYAFFSAFTGVVIFVNVIFKDLYGRPRPRQTMLWPNSTNPEMWDFYSVWEPAFLKDPSLIDAGKSFPSGHVSVVAVFVIFFFIFMHPKFWARIVQKGKKETKIQLFSMFKWAGLTISIILGILTGVGRIVVGAHHASDVLWAFGMVYIINALFYYIIFRIPRYEKKILNKEKNN